MKRYPKNNFKTYKLNMKNKRSLGPLELTNKKVLKEK